MKVLYKFRRSPLRRIRVLKQKYVHRVRLSLVRIKHGLAQEKRETREMLLIYTRYTQGKASKEDMKIANRQFGDLLKGLGIGVVAILPFAPITIPIVVKVGRMFGVEVMPSAFNNLDQGDQLELDVVDEVSIEETTEDEVLQITKKEATK